ncbi:MAG: hypothetical protein ACP5VQ_05700, partial [Phycisphaerae bacterium]
EALRQNVKPGVLVSRAYARISPGGQTIFAKLATVKAILGVTAFGETDTESVGFINTPALRLRYAFG